MKKNNETIDGIDLETWKEIEMIAKTYPKPIRFSDNINSKIALLKFYLEPLLPDLNPPIMAMDKGKRVRGLQYQP